MMKQIAGWILHREIKKLLKQVTGYTRSNPPEFWVGELMEHKATDKEWTLYCSYNSARNRLGNLVQGGYIQRKR